MKLITRAMETNFQFESKPAAREFFASLQDAFYQKNYCAQDSGDYAEYEKKIEEMIAQGVQA